MPIKHRLLPSLHADTARPPVDTPPLDGDRRVSVAVIGGGFTGLSTALHLAEQGTDVTVLEANEPGWGASGRNGGQVNPGLKHDPAQVEADFGPDLGGRMVAMSWGAPDFVFNLIQRQQITCEASQTGTLRAAYSQAGAAEIKASYEQGAQRAMPVQLLDAAKLRAGTGADRYVAALLDPRGGHLNPLGYARGLAQAAIQAGAKVHGGSPALSVSRQGGGWAVRLRPARCRRNNWCWPPTATPTGYGTACNGPWCPFTAVSSPPNRYPRQLPVRSCRWRHRFTKSEG